MINQPRLAAMLRESLLAVLVLALFCLNFGAVQTASATPGQGTAVTVASVCGDPLDSGDAGHLVCHACRPTLADLPPAPSDVAPVVFGVTTVVYAGAIACHPAHAPGQVVQPRGPPLLG